VVGGAALVGVLIGFMRSRGSTVQAAKFRQGGTFYLLALPGGCMYGCQCPMGLCVVQ